LFTSDNGPWQNLPDRMLQRGVERWHAGTTGLLNGYKGTTYEGGFRVPAIIRWPDVISKGQVSHELVTTMDLFCTLIDIAGAKIPDDRKIDGNSVYSLLKEGKYTSPEILFYCQGVSLQSVRKGKWKLRATKELGYELFDLDFDPGEKYNRAESNKELVNELYKELINFSTETGAQIEQIED